MFTETLTGFKHMGNKSHKVMLEGETVLFAFEEAIGFMCGSAVLDKVRNDILKSDNHLKTIQTVRKVESCIFWCFNTEK